MANVAGKYSIYCKLPFGNDGTAAAYQFTGNDRDANFTASIPDKILETVCTSSDLAGGFAAFAHNADLIILRARLNAEGAPGLQNSPDKFAGRFYLSIIKYITGIDPDSGNLGQELDTLKLSFKHWGEWTEINGRLKPYKTDTNWSSLPNWQRLCRLGFKYQNCIFTCDDFNLQEDFVGQDLGVSLELEIDAPGIYSSNDGSIY